MTMTRPVFRTMISQLLGFVLALTIRFRGGCDPGSPICFHAYPSDPDALATLPRPPLQVSCIDYLPCVIVNGIEPPL
jgi:hypothetical protein